MRYLSHVDKYLTLKYKYFKMVLEYYSSTSTSTKYYISGDALHIIYQYLLKPLETCFVVISNISNQQAWVTLQCLNAVGWATETAFRV